MSESVTSPELQILKKRNRTLQYGTENWKCDGCTTNKLWRV